MRKIGTFFSTALLFSALSLLFSCEPQIEVGPGGTLELVFGDAHLMSKAEVSSDDGRFKWGDLDTVAIWFNGSTSRYEQFWVNGGVVDVDGTEGTRARYAVYPWTAVPGSGQEYSSESPRVIYPDTYNTSGEEADSRMPVIALNDASSSKLVFYHTGALLRIKVDGWNSKYKSAKVSFGSTVVTGTYTVDVQDATSPKAMASGLVSGGGKEVVFNLPDVPKRRTYLNVPVPLPAPGQSYAQETLTLTLYTGSNATSIDGTPANEPKSFSTTINLKDLKRADGRFVGFTLSGLSEDVAAVRITHLPPENTLYLYDSPYVYNLIASVIYTDGDEKSDPSLVDWTSSNSNVVKVDENGLIVAVASMPQNATTADSVRITAVSRENGQKKDEVAIWVANYAPTGSFVEKPFSVGSGRTVIFSPGYLQVTLDQDQSAENASWEFARYQYDIIGPEVNSTISLTAGSRTDLFYSPTSPDFGIVAGGTYMEGQDRRHYEFFDWGMNEISYRGVVNPSHTYRAMTTDEWDYIINKRTGAEAATIGAVEDCRYACVTVNGVEGVLLFPGGFVWNRYTMGEFPSRINVSFSSVGNYSGTQWINIEKEGAVFLPYAGSRNGSSYSSSGNQLRISTEGSPSIGQDQLQSYDLPIYSTFKRTQVVSITSFDNYFEGNERAVAVRLVKNDDASRKPIRKMEIEESVYTNLVQDITSGATTTDGAYYYVSMPKDTDEKTITSKIYYCDGTSTSDNATVEMCLTIINPRIESNVISHHQHLYDSRITAIIENFPEIAESIFDPVDLKLENGKYKLEKKRAGYSLVRFKPSGRELYSVPCFVGASRGTILNAVTLKEYQPATSDVWASVDMNVTPENPSATFFFAPEAYSIPSTQLAMDTTRLWMPTGYEYVDHNDYRQRGHTSFDYYYFVNKFTGAGTTDRFFYPARFKDSPKRKYLWRQFDRVYGRDLVYHMNGQQTWFPYVYADERNYLASFYELWMWSQNSGDTGTDLVECQDYQFLNGVQISCSNTGNSVPNQNITYDHSEGSFRLPSGEELNGMNNFCHIYPGFSLDVKRITVNGTECIAIPPLGTFYPEFLSDGSDYNKAKKQGYWIQQEYSNLENEFYLSKISGSMVYDTRPYPLGEPFDYYEEDRPSTAFLTSDGYVSTLMKKPYVAGNYYAPPYEILTVHLFYWIWAYDSEPSSSPYLSLQKTLPLRYDTECEANMEYEMEYYASYADENLYSLTKPIYTIRLWREVPAMTP